MPTINITHEAHQLLKQHSRTGEFVAGESRQLANSTWDIQVGEDTIERMNEVKFKEETFSDLIFRICGTQKGTN